jgi:hypothetical protein
MKADINEVIETFIRRSLSVVSLGSLVSSLSFLSGVLRSHGDILADDIDEEMSTLEEVYRVALDREWKEFPADERQLVLEAARQIRSKATKST